MTRDTTNRFTGLAELYSRCRPDYPASAVAFILERCQLGSGSILVDIGCGTGISSRLFAVHGLRVIGIEPNADMRLRAEEEPLSSGTAAPDYRTGRAEDTGLPDDCADAVLAAQAFHWFDSDRALDEFHRILRPGGWAALIWNERDAGDPATAAYGKVLAATPEGPAIETRRATSGFALLQHPRFRDTSRDVFSHEQRLDREGLVNRALSASYAPREPAAVARFTADLRAVFERFQQGGQVALRYQTIVFTGKK